jgi:Tol biopolymer transport system component
MGDVWRATDTRLNRQVALKIVRPEALARFSNEARTVAALNHPNIVALHDVGPDYLVTELVDGQTLHSTVGGKPLPLRAVTDIGAQIADALAAAHAAGITHRDLKPENVILSRDGRVKVLDFGIAKATSDPGGETRTLHATEPGAVVGTPAYMSPEQIRGRALDHRSDIFSLGVVLYEMTSGMCPFSGPSRVETMNAVLNQDPADLPPSTPQPLVRIITRCLEKDPTRRFQSASDLAFALRSLPQGTTQNQMPPAPRAQPWLPSAIAAALAGAFLTAGAAWLYLARTRAEPASIRHLTHSGTDSSPAVSPDGRIVAFSSFRDGRQRIWMKQLPTGAEAALTSGPDDLPRFSPDGSMVLFLRSEEDRRSLYRTPVLAADERRLLKDVVGADWSHDGREIAFIRWSTAGAVSEVGILSAATGESRIVARAEGDLLLHPRWSADGKHIAAKPWGVAGGVPDVITLVNAENGAIQRIRIAATGFGLSAVEWNGSSELIYFTAESIGGGYAIGASSPGWIVAQDLSGTVRRLFWTGSGAEITSIAGEGRLIFDTRSPRQNLREANLDGPHPAARWLTRGSSNDRQPVYSPDGSRVLFTSNRSGNLDVWELAVATGAVRRLTDDPGEDWDPAYAANGTKIVWSSTRTGTLEVWTANADGTEPRALTHGAQAENPGATPDGEWFVYSSGAPDKLGVWRVRADGSSAVRLAAGPLIVPELSPDGRYVSFVQVAAPDRTLVRVVRVSDGAQVIPDIVLRVPNQNYAGASGRTRWLPNGRKLAFTGQDDRGVAGIYVQDIEPGRDTNATRRPLCCFDTDAVTESFAISPDGRRITIASWEQMFSLVSAERVPGIRPRR